MTIGTLTVKLLALVARPPGAITVIGPVVAPLGTVAVICVSEFTVKDAFVPLKATTEAEVNAVPVRTTLVPTVPLVGEKLVIEGAVAPSTFARKTAATFAGNAEKKVNPVSASI